MDIQYTFTALHVLMKVKELRCTFLLLEYTIKIHTVIETLESKESEGDICIQSLSCDCMLHMSVLQAKRAVGYCFLKWCLCFIGLHMQGADKKAWVRVFVDFSSVTACATLVTVSPLPSAQSNPPMLCDVCLYVGCSKVRPHVTSGWCHWHSCFLES